MKKPLPLCTTYIVIGVTDDGQPTGLAITDELLRALADLRSNGNILPIPSMAVQRMELHRVAVAVIEVYPSEMPPVRYRGQTWIRVGPRRDIATLEEERRLTERRVAGTRTFDQWPCVGAALDDVLIESFRNEYLPRVVAPGVLARNERAPEEQLASLRFFDLRERAPTNAGLLVLGRDPLAYLPGAFIQFVRFEGDELTDRIQDEKVITGNLLTQLLQLDNLLPLQIRSARISGRGLRHEERPDYPLAAIREVALNAVMHRTYEGTSAPVRINWFQDRVEIQNPGGLYGQLTPQNFDHATDYRNPVIAEAMKGLGYVERFGTGIARTRKALADNENPPPEFVFEPTHTLVTIRRRN